MSNGHINNHNSCVSNTVLERRCSIHDNKWLLATTTLNILSEMFVCRPSAVRERQMAQSRWTQFATFRHLKTWVLLHHMLTIRAVFWPTSQPAFPALSPSSMSLRSSSRRYFSSCVICTGPPAPLANCHVWQSSDNNHSSDQIVVIFKSGPWVFELKNYINFPLKKHNMSNVRLQSHALCPTWTLTYLNIFLHKVLFIFAPGNPTPAAFWLVCPLFVTHFCQVCCCGVEVLFTCVGVSGGWYMWRLVQEDVFVFFMSMALFLLQHIGWLSFIFHSPSSM